MVSVFMSIKIWESFVNQQKRFIFAYLNGRLYQTSGIINLILGGRFIKFPRTFVRGFFMPKC